MDIIKVSIFFFIYQKKKKTLNFFLHYSLKILIEKDKKNNKQPNGKNIEKTNPSACGIQLKRIPSHFKIANLSAN